MADDTGSKHDVICLSRHLLNCAATNRTISKQECMVLVGGLDLVKCSETIETVSISGQYRIQPGETNTLYKQYEKHPASLHHLSLDQFFDHVHNRGGNATVPHYVGGRSQPVYPATEGYARASLIIHKPWHKGVKPFSDDIPVIDQFHEFIQSASCPVSLKIPYERMHYRHLEKLTNQEPVAGDMNESSTCGIDEDIIEMLQIAATFNAQNSDDLSGTYTFEKGESYEWDRDPLLVRNQIFSNDPLKSAKQHFLMDHCIHDSSSIKICQTRIFNGSLFISSTEGGRRWQNLVG